MKDKAIRCPHCHKRLADCSCDTKVIIIGKFDKEKHDNVYSEDPSKYEDWFKTKCECSDIVAYKIV